MLFFSRLIRSAYGHRAKAGGKARLSSAIEAVKRIVKRDECTAPQQFKAWGSLFSGTAILIHEKSTGEKA